MLDRVTARLELDKSIPQAGPSVVIQTRRALYIGRIEVSVPVVDHAKVGQPQFQEPGASAGGERCINFTGLADPGSCAGSQPQLCASQRLYGAPRHYSPG